MAKTGMVRVFALIFAVLALWSPLGSTEPGKVGGKPELDVPYEPTSYGITRAMLTMAGVTSSDFVYDLGCGDGRIVIMAAKERGARGVGVDLDPERIKESKQNAERAGVSNLVRFSVQDLFKTDIRDATVVMIYLYPDVNLRLRPKLLSDLKPGTRVVSHSHTMGAWQADEVRRVEEHFLYFFVVPANASGTWRWSFPDGSRAVMALTQRFQKAAGSLTVRGRAYPVADATLKGDVLRFSVIGLAQPGGEPSVFEGRIKGDAMEGTILNAGPNGRREQFTAARDPSSSVSIVE